MHDCRKKPVNVILHIGKLWTATKERKKEIHGIRDGELHVSGWPNIFEKEVRWFSWSGGRGGHHRPDCMQKKDSLGVELVTRQPC